MNIVLTATPKSDTILQFVCSRNSPRVADFEAQPNQTTLRYQKRKKIIWCGLGKSSDCTPHTLRTACSHGIQTARCLKIQNISLVVPTLSECGCVGDKECLEGALLGAYCFSKYKGKPEPQIHTLNVCGSSLTPEQVHTIQTVCESVWYARDLVNDNAHIVTPHYLSTQALSLSDATPVTTQVFNETQLRDQGLGLITAVGSGSPYPPRLILMDYRGKPRSSSTTALIGKGITFDAGGQNLKSSGHIETMRSDMAGAAAILGFMRIVSLLRPPINVVGVIPAAHNAVDGFSCFPGDVYRAYDGKHIEIGNTDAEGRLVLADAIAYTKKKYAPKRIVDLATLTGGILITFGDIVAGLFSNNDSLASDLSAAANRTHERVWRLPLFPEYSEAMKSDIADVRNIAQWKRGHASSLTGAAFIKEFVEDTPWAHIDIAGTAFNEREARGDIPKYATGFGVRLLWDFMTGSHAATHRQTATKRKSHADPRK